MTLGVASLSVSSLGPGEHHIWARYDGTASFFGSVSPAISLNVENNHRPLANSVTFTRQAGLDLKISIADLLAAQTSDADGDTRVLAAIGTPGPGGTVSSVNGYLLYRNAGSTDDAFTYSVSDGRGGHRHRHDHHYRDATAWTRDTADFGGGRRGRGAVPRHPLFSSMTSNAPRIC